MMRRWAVFLSLLLTLVACEAPRGTCRVTLIVDGETRQVTTEAFTVRELLQDANVTLDADDRVSPPEPTLLRDDTTVRVIRGEIRIETERREVPYDRRTVHDATIPAADTRLLEPGVVGIEEMTYRVTLEDGVEVDRRLVERRTIRNPRTEVVLVGAQRDRKPVSIAGTLVYLSNRNAWLMRQTSLNEQRLTHTGDLDGRVFELSPDGSHLLFTRAPTETEESALLNTFWILETRTAQPEPVRVAVDGILWAAWEPGCEVSHTGSKCRIAYTKGTSSEGNSGWRAENDLWVARPRPSTGDLFAERQVLEAATGDAYSWWGTTYTWSPDAQTLAYGAAGEVGVIRVRDGRQEALHQFSPFRTYAPWVWTPIPIWSPEASYIVTAVHGPPPTDEAPEDSPVFDIWALSADGTITAELASGVGMWSAPAYSPDGGAIAFGRARNPYASHTSNYELYVMDRDGSDRQRIFPPQNEIGLNYPEMAWGPQGNRIAVVYQDNLYLLEVPGGTVHQLTVSGGVSTVRWAPGTRDSDD